MTALISSAFTELYGKEPDQITFSISYSKKFSPYNANVKYRGNKFHFSLSYLWKDISTDIKKGVIQYLLLKSFKGKIKPITESTLSIQLYNSFIKNIGEYTPKGKSDPLLHEIYLQINKQYFSGLIEISAICWGKNSKRTLGNYHYGSDKITISTIFQNIKEEDIDLLYFVIYHEMLHKKHKFNSSSTGKKMHHTGLFKIEEKKFPNHDLIQKRLRFLAYNKRQTKKKVFSLRDFMKR